MSWEEHYRAFIEEHRDEAGDIAPPWAAFPGFTRTTIGWRMGYGEDWLYGWGQWLKEQPEDEDWRRAYLSRHPPAPYTWAELVHNTLDSGWRRPMDRAALIAAGLVGEDVAYGTWLASQEEMPSWGKSTPAELVRYQCRPLSFWMRWARGQALDTVTALLTESTPPPTPWQRTVDALTSWLRPRPPDSPWAGVLAALRDGAPPEAPPTPDSGYTRIVVELAASSDPRPPWVLSGSPDDLPFSEGNQTYTQAWRLWVASAFDDPPTWQAHLAAVAPMPADWQEATARHFRWLWE